MSGYSSAQEDVSDSAKPAQLIEQDMLVVSDDVPTAPRSGRESLEVSDDETSNKVIGQKMISGDETLEMKRIAFQKPSLSLTVMTEDEDGNVSLRTEEYEEDKHVTMIMDNEGADSQTGEGTGKDEDCVTEDLGEALKDMKVMSSLMKSRKSTASSRSAGMKRWKGTIVNDSDSDDDDIVAKLSLMLLKSDETPVLTVPVNLDDGCLTDTENFED